MTPTPTQVAALVRSDYQAAYNKRMKFRKELTRFLGDPTMSLEYAGSRALADLQLAECTWESFAYVSKALHNATGHPATADLDISSFSDEEVLMATLKARENAVERLMYNDGEQTGIGVTWTVAHRLGDRAFLLATSGVPAAVGMMARAS